MNAPRVAGPGAWQGQRVQIHRVTPQHRVVTRRQQVPLRSRTGHVPEQLRHRHAVAQIPGRLRLLQAAQLAPEGFEIPGLLHPHGPHHPLQGAEQVDGHGPGAADHVFEQQGRATHGQHAIGDGGHLQVRIDGCRNAPQLTALLE